MTDDKLIVDEAQRAANYEVLKSKVESDVRSDIAAKAERRPTAGTAQLAEDMNARAVDDVAETRSEIDRGRVAARISQVVDYVFFVIYGLLAVRLILELFAAREGVAFFRLIACADRPDLLAFQRPGPESDNAGRFFARATDNCRSFRLCFVAHGHKRAFTNDGASKSSDLALRTRRSDDHFIGKNGPEHFVRERTIFDLERLIHIQRGLAIVCQHIYLAQH